MGNLEKIINRINRKNGFTNNGYNNGVFHRLKDYVLKTFGKSKNEDDEMSLFEERYNDFLKIYEPYSIGICIEKEDNSNGEEGTTTVVYTDKGPVLKRESQIDIRSKLFSDVQSKVYLVRYEGFVPNADGQYLYTIATKTKTDDSVDGSKYLDFDIIVRGLDGHFTRDCKTFVVNADHDEEELNEEFLNCKSYFNGCREKCFLDVDRKEYCKIQSRTI